MKKWAGKLLFLIFGLLSLIWFLIRVIPKPQRAMYPCQRAAFPMASAFVIWLIGVFSSVTFLRWIKLFVRKRKGTVILPLLLMLLLLSSSVVIFMPWGNISASVESYTAFEPTDGPNQPIGEPKGIVPGRVVWAFDRNATSWNGFSNYWHSDENIDKDVVSKMFQNSILTVANSSNLEAAWDQIFRYFNLEHGKGDLPYQMGEKIAVKLNMNNAKSYSMDNHGLVTPQLIYVLLSSLVNDAGVPEEDIVFYDISRHIPDKIVTLCIADFPHVNFVDSEGNGHVHKFIVDSLSQVHWSEELTLEEGGGNTSYLPVCLVEAAYLINLANLKGHNLAGVTLCAKNHLGTFHATNPDDPGLQGPIAAGVHPYLTVHEYHQGGHWDFPAIGDSTYNPLVDLMGHKDIGGKTLLYILDAFYVAQNQSEVLAEKNKWQLGPFYGDWTSSLFVSLDPVAIESVGIDFLRSETSQTQIYGTVDSYLHEAAQAGAPPSNTVYDPEDDGTVLKSLGVHEHWNNAHDKLYTGNMAPGMGIELVRVNSTTAAPIRKINKKLFNVFPNPVTNVIWFELDDVGLTDIHAEILEVSGKILFQKDIGDLNESRKFNLDVSSLNTGVYFLRIGSKSDQVYFSKFIKR